MPTTIEELILRSVFRHEDAPELEMALLNGARLSGEAIAPGYERQPVTDWDLDDNRVQLTAVFGPLQARTRATHVGLVHGQELLKPLRLSKVRMIEPGQSLEYRLAVELDDVA